MALTSMPRRYGAAGSKRGSGHHRRRLRHLARRL